MPQNNYTVTVEGVQYDILQFDARTAAKVQLKLAALVSDMPALSDLFTKQDQKGEDEMLALLLQCVGQLPEDKVFYLIDLMFLNIRCNHIDGANGLGKKRHPQKGVVNIDQMSADDLLIIYKLAFESVKANFGNFFQQLKQISVFNISPVQAP